MNYIHKTAYPTETPDCGDIKCAFNSKTYEYARQKFVLRKFPLHVSMKIVLSGTHALHFCFILNKSVTGTVISANRPFIILCISCELAFYPLHVQYLCGHCVTFILPTQILRASSSRIEELCHRITKFCICFVYFLSVIY